MAPDAFTMEQKTFVISKEKGAKIISNLTALHVARQMDHLLSQMRGQFQTKGDQIRRGPNILFQKSFVNFDGKGPKHSFKKILNK